MYAHFSQWVNPIFATCHFGLKIGKSGLDVTNTHTFWPLGKNLFWPEDRICNLTQSAKWPRCDTSTHTSQLFGQHKCINQCPVTSVTSYLSSCKLSFRTSVMKLEMTIFGVRDTAYSGINRPTSACWLADDLTLNIFVINYYNTYNMKGFIYCYRACHTAHT